MPRRRETPGSRGGSGSDGTGRAQPFPAPHPRKQIPGWAAAEPRAPAETRGRRPCPTDAKGHPECLPTPPPPRPVHPCPLLPPLPVLRPGDRCQEGLPGPGKVWGFAGERGGLSRPGRGAARVGEQPPRGTPARPGVGAAFTFGVTPLFSEPGGSKQPNRG